VIATVRDPAVVRAILAHLGLAPDPDHPGPAPPSPRAHHGHRVTRPLRELALMFPMRILSAPHQIRDAEIAMVRETG
jgi:hypothetical protein